MGCCRSTCYRHNSNRIPLITIEASSELATNDTVNIAGRNVDRQPLPASKILIKLVSSSLNLVAIAEEAEDNDEPGTEFDDVPQFSNMLKLLEKTEHLPRQRAKNGVRNNLFHFLLKLIHDNGGLDGSNDVENKDALTSVVSVMTKEL